MTRERFTDVAALDFLLKGIENNWTPGKWREELADRFGVVEIAPGEWDVEGNDEPDL